VVRCWVGSCSNHGLPLLLFPEIAWQLLNLISLDCGVSVFVDGYLGRECYFYD
jgi:hypothetical protein